MNTLNNFNNIWNGLPVLYELKRKLTLNSLIKHLVIFYRQEKRFKHVNFIPIIYDEKVTKNICIYTNKYLRKNVLPIFLKCSNYFVISVTR